MAVIEPPYMDGAAGESARLRPTSVITCPSHKLTSKKKPKNPSICLVTETPGQFDNQAIDSISQAQQTRKSNRELPIELYVDASGTLIRVKSHLISTIFLKQGTSIYVHSHSSIWFHIFHSPEKQEMFNMSANTAGWKTATEGTTPT